MNNIFEIEQKVVAIATTWVGTPYQHQASLRNVGCDCLGLLRGVWRELYGVEPEEIPHYPARWMDALGNQIQNKQDPLVSMAEKYFARIEHKSEVKKADILLFNYRANLPAKHIGIAISQDYFIHAYSGKGVVKNRLSAWWLRHMVGHYGWVNSTPNDKLMDK